MANKPVCHAIVDSTYRGGGRDSDAIPRFSTIQAALDAAPSDGKSPFVIAIRNGNYREKIIVTNPNITLLGEDRDRTVLRFDDYSGVKDANGQSIGTWRCASLIIRAPDFRATNLTVENTFDYLGNDAKDDQDPSRCVRHISPGARGCRCAGRGGERSPDKSERVPPT